MANGLALSPSADFCEERVREEAISPAELVSVDLEGDGGGDWLMRETGSARRSGSLTTLGTRSGSAGRSLAMRRGNGGGLPMEHAEDVVHMRRRIVEGHDKIGVRADLGGHLKYSQRWSGVRAGVLLGAQGAVRRGESRGGL